MSKPGVKKKSPPTDELKRLKDEVRRLTKELQARDQELAEAFDQQWAAGRILQVIAGSPNNLQRVLDTIAENAARLCDANDVVIYRRDGDFFDRVAVCGQLPLGEIRRRMTRGRPVSRAMIDLETIHVLDLASEINSEFPESKKNQEITGTRTVLAVPLLREGVSIGAIYVRRNEVRPFSEKQIALLKTFADQAVIAIENVRLFHELQAKNRDLTKALDQQVATSEILRAIANSPTELQPVFDTIVASAARLCDSEDARIYCVEGEMVRKVAACGFVPREIAVGETRPIIRGSVAGRAILDRKAIHVHDVLADGEYADNRYVFEPQGVRTMLAVPLLREEVCAGAITVIRKEVRPFSNSQIALLKTFADQAVIAIENVRLFRELQARNRDLSEALEQQTATSEILSVIASSPKDIQPVLDTIAKKAANLCDAEDAAIFHVDGNLFRNAAHFGPVTMVAGVGEGRVLDRGFVPGRAIIDKQTVHVPDLQAAFAEFPHVKDYGVAMGLRTVLSTPLMREGEGIGAIHIRRREVRPFTEKQIRLLETFADQAVIAIENVRLLQELQNRNSALTEALEQQTATSQVLSVIAQSPTNLQPVYQTISPT